MNRKIILGTVAGVAAIGLAYGGTTYSAWSDFGDIKGNSVSTGILKLDLNAQHGGKAVPLNFGSFAPGMGFVQTVWIASSNGESVPNAALSVTINNLKDFENGCGSTNSEQVADASCVDSTKGDGLQGGELSSNLGTDMYSWTPKTAGDCTNYPDGQKDTNLIHSSTLKSQVGKKLDVATLAPGQGVCVRIEQYLPSSAGNEVQSDSVAYDLHFDLVQS